MRATTALVVVLTGVARALVAPHGATSRLCGPSLSLTSAGLRAAATNQDPPPSPSLARELSRASTAVAAGLDGPLRFLTPVKRRALRTIREDFSPAELADVAYAYAGAGVSAEALFETIKDAAAARLGAFGDDELADVAFSLARARAADAAFLDAVADQR